MLTLPLVKRKRMMRFRLRAAGHAVATAHVPTHALGGAVYAIKAAAVHSGNVDDGIIKERNWQLQRLLKYAKHSSDR